MTSNTKAIPQHKRLAMGDKVGFKKGGSMGMGGAKLLKTGIPDSPIEMARRSNGIPGMKNGGSK